LAEYKVSRVVVNKLEVGSEEMQSVLSGLLLLYNKKLTETQLENVMTSIYYEPTALYLSLAVNVVRHWTSLDGHLNETNPLKQDLKTGLQGTVSGLINQIFNQLEIDYGKILTRFAVGFIAFSVSGRKCH